MDHQHRSDPNSHEFGYIVSEANSASSASTYNFTLQSTSALINAGDPSTSDPDGSRADIGAFGGAGGSWD